MRPEVFTTVRDFYGRRRLVLCGGQFLLFAVVVCARGHRFLSGSALCCGWPHLPHRNFYLLVSVMFPSWAVCNDRPMLMSIDKSGRRK